MVKKSTDKIISEFNHVPAIREKNRKVVYSSCIYVVLKCLIPSFLTVQLLRSSCVEVSITVCRIKKKIRETARDLRADILC